MKRLASLGTGLCALLASCQSHHPALQPAELDIASSAQIESLKAVLTEALGRTVTQTVPAEMRGTRTLAVPPPPLSEHETRSPAKPAVFDVMLDAGACVLVQRETGEVYPIEDMPCRAVDG